MPSKKKNDSKLQRDTLYVNNVVYGDEYAPSTDLELSGFRGDTNMDSMINKNSIVWACAVHLDYIFTL